MMAAKICHMNMRFVSQEVLLHGLDPKVLHRLRIVDCRSLQCKMLHRPFVFGNTKCFPCTSNA